MAEILTIALHAEGSTDYTFLKPIIERSIKDIILNSEYDVELYPLYDIKKQPGKKYIDDVIDASIEAKNAGMKCLILHCDADSNTIEKVMQYKIQLAVDAIQNFKTPEVVCQKIVPIIPVYMTESWMLADMELLISEINAEKIDKKILGFTKKPEEYSDPKATIEHAISTTKQQKGKRHRTFTIAELYSPLAQKLDLNKLKTLSSYQTFYDTLQKNCLPYC